MASIPFTKTPVSVDPAKTVISKSRRLVEARIRPGAIDVLFSNTVTQDDVVIADNVIPGRAIPLANIPQEVTDALAVVVAFLNENQDQVESDAKDELAAASQPVSAPPNP